MLKLSDVKKTYQNGSHSVEVLKGVHLELNQASTASIIGPSGSGKSTLLSLITGLEVPDSGTIEIAGTAMDQASADERARLRLKNIGIVFQNYFLIPHLSAIENILMPALLSHHVSADTRARADDLLAQVGLKDRAHHRPTQLSGGEQQRVAIARALLLRPALVVADEPTGNLDEETAEQISSLLFERVAQTQASLILVTHDLKRAKRCQRCFRLTQGLLKESNETALV